MIENCLTCVPSPGINDITGVHIFHPGTLVRRAYVETLTQIGIVIYASKGALVTVLWPNTETVKNSTVMTVQ